MIRINIGRQLYDAARLILTCDSRKPVPLNNDHERALLTLCRLYEMDAAHPQPRRP